MALVVAFIFTLTSVTWNAPAHAAPVEAAAAPVFFAIENLMIPEEMGTISKTYRGKRGTGNVERKSMAVTRLPLPVPRHDRMVVLIQDAHAVVDAQENIRNILGHLRKNYGVNLTALEGAKGRLEPILLRTFPEPSVKRKILAGYENRAELSGPEMAAVFQEETGDYRGMEDWGLYEQNYFAYLRAQEKKPALLGKWNGFKQALDSERAKVYDAKLNEFHEARENFLEERASLLDLLVYLSEFRGLLEVSQKSFVIPAQAGIQKRGSPTKAFGDDNKTGVGSVAAEAGYKELPALIASIGYEKSGKQEALVPMVRKIADEFKVKYLRGLGVKTEMNFYNRYQAFMTGRITAGQMLQYLVEVGRENGKAVKLPAELRKLLGHTELLSQIKGSLLGDELQRFLSEVESSLIKTPAQKELALKYQHLFLLKDLINLELTHEGLAKYQSEIATGAKSPRNDMAGNLTHDPVIARRPKADEAISNLSKRTFNDPEFQRDLQPALEFYRAALERDQAFYENVMKLMQGNRVEGIGYRKNSNPNNLTPKPYTLNAIAVVAGGFHTNGLERILREKGVEYAVVTPKIASLSGIENYAKVMKGDVSFKSDLKTTYFDGLMRHAAKALVEALPINERVRTLKVWRDNVIRELAREGRITEAGKFLPYIDELLRSHGEAASVTPERTKEEIIEIVRKELAKFKKDSFAKIWKTFEFQLGAFTDGLKQLIAKKDLNAQSVTSLLDRASQSKPSFIPPQRVLDPEGGPPVFSLLPGLLIADERAEKDVGMYFSKEGFGAYLIGSYADELEKNPNASIGLLVRNKLSAYFDLDTTEGRESAVAFMRRVSEHMPTPESAGYRPSIPRRAVTDMPIPKRSDIFPEEEDVAPAKPTQSVTMVTNLFIFLRRLGLSPEMSWLLFQKAVLAMIPLERFDSAVQSSFHKYILKIFFQGEDPAPRLQWIQKIAAESGQGAVDPDQSRRLIELLRYDEYVSVKIAAAQALGKFKVLEALGDLRAVAGDPAVNERVQKAARDAIRQINARTEARSESRDEMGSDALKEMGLFVIKDISVPNAQNAATALSEAAEMDRVLGHRGDGDSWVVAVVLPDSSLIIAPRWSSDGETYWTHRKLAEAVGFKESMDATVLMSLSFGNGGINQGILKEFLVVRRQGQREKDLIPLLMFLREAFIKMGNSAESVDSFKMQDPFEEKEARLGDLIERSAKPKAPVARAANMDLRGFFRKTWMLFAVLGLFAVNDALGDASLQAQRMAPGNAVGPLASGRGIASVFEASMVFLGAGLLAIAIHELSHWIVARIIRYRDLSEGKPSIKKATFGMELKKGWAVVRIEVYGEFSLSARKLLALDASGLTVNAVLGLMSLILSFVYSEVLFLPAFSVANFVLVAFDYWGGLDTIRTLGILKTMELHKEYRKKNPAAKNIQEMSPGGAFRDFPIFKTEDGIYQYIYSEENGPSPTISYKYFAQNGVEALLNGELEGTVWFDGDEYALYRVVDFPEKLLSYDSSGSRKDVTPDGKGPATGRAEMREEGGAGAERKSSYYILNQGRSPAEVAEMIRNNAEQGDRAVKELQGTPLTIDVYIPRVEATKGAVPGSSGVLGRAKLAVAGLKAQLTHAKFRLIGPEEYIALWRQNGMLAESPFDEIRGEAFDNPVPKWSVDPASDLAFIFPYLPHSQAMETVLRDSGVPYLPLPPFPYASPQDNSRIVDLTDPFGSLLLDPEFLRRKREKDLWSDEMLASRRVAFLSTLFRDENADSLKQKSKYIWSWAYVTDDDRLMMEFFLLKAWLERLPKDSPVFAPNGRRLLFFVIGDRAENFRKYNELWKDSLLEIVPVSRLSSKQMRELSTELSGTFTKSKENGRQFWVDFPAGVSGAGTYLEGKSAGSITRHDNTDVDRTKESQLLALRVKRLVMKHPEKSWTEIDELALASLRDDLLGRPTDRFDDLRQWTLDSRDFSDVMYKYFDWSRNAAAFLASARSERGVKRAEMREASDAGSDLARENLDLPARASVFPETAAPAAEWISRIIDQRQRYSSPVEESIINVLKASPINRPPLIKKLPPSVKKVFLQLAGLESTPSLRSGPVFNRVNTSTELTRVEGAAAHRFLQAIQLAQLEGHPTLPVTYMGLSRVSLNGEFPVLFFREKRDLLPGKNLTHILALNALSDSFAEITEFYFVNGRYAGYGMTGVRSPDFTKLNMQFHIFKEFAKQGLGKAFYQWRLELFKTFIPEGSTAQVKIDPFQFERNPEYLPWYLHLLRDEGVRAAKPPQANGAPDYSGGLVFSLTSSGARQEVRSEARERIAADKVKAGDFIGKGADSMVFKVGDSAYKVYEDLSLEVIAFYGDVTAAIKTKLDNKEIGKVRIGDTERRVVVEINPILDTYKEGGEVLSISPYVDGIWLRALLGSDPVRLEEALDKAARATDKGFLEVCQRIAARDREALGAMSTMLARQSMEIMEDKELKAGLKLAKDLEGISLQNSENVMLKLDADGAIRLIVTDIATAIEYVADSRPAVRSEARGDALMFSNNESFENRIKKLSQPSVLFGRVYSKDMSMESVALSGEKAADLEEKIGAIGLINLEMLVREMIGNARRESQGRVDIRVEFYPAGEVLKVIVKQTSISERAWGNLSEISSVFQSKGARYLATFSNPEAGGGKGFFTKLGAWMEHGSPVFLKYCKGNDPEYPMAAELYVDLSGFPLQDGAEMRSLLSAQERQVVDRARQTVFAESFRRAEKAFAGGALYTEESFSRVQKGPWGEASLRDRMAGSDGTPAVFHSLSLSAYPAEGSLLKTRLLALTEDFLRQLPFAKEKFFMTAPAAYHFTLQPVSQVHKEPYSAGEIDAARAVAAKITGELKPFDVWAEGVTIDPLNGRIQAEVIFLDGKEPVRMIITLYTPFVELTSGERDQLFQWVRSHRDDSFGRMTVDRFHLVHSRNIFADQTISREEYILGPPRSLKEIIAPYVPKSREVSFIDLDTGLGNFIFAFQDFLTNVLKYKVSMAKGTEPLSDLKTQTPESLRPDITHANAQIPEDFSSLPQKAFDIVTINNIETAPGELSKRARELLKPGGVLLVTVEQVDAEREDVLARITSEIESAGFAITITDMPADYPRYDTLSQAAKLIVAVPVTRSETRQTMQLKAAAIDLAALSGWSPDSQVRVILAADNSRTLSENAKVPMDPRHVRGLKRLLEVNPGNQLIVNSGDATDDMAVSQGPLKSALGPSMERYQLVSGGGQRIESYDRSGMIAHSEQIEAWPAATRIRYCAAILRSFYAQILEDISRETGLHPVLRDLDRKDIEASRAEAEKRFAAIADPIRWADGRDTTKVKFDFPLVSGALRERLGNIYFYDAGALITLEFQHKAEAISDALSGPFLGQVAASLQKEIGLAEGDHLISDSTFIDISRATKASGVERLVKEQMDASPEAKTVVILMGDGRNDLATFALARALSAQYPQAMFLSFYSNQAFDPDLPEESYVSSRPLLDGALEVIEWAAAASSKPVSQVPVLNVLKWQSARAEMRGDDLEKQLGEERDALQRAAAFQISQLPAHSFWKTHWMYAAELPPEEAVRVPSPQWPESEAQYVYWSDAHKVRAKVIQYLFGLVASTKQAGFKKRLKAYKDFLEDLNETQSPYKGSWLDKEKVGRLRIEYEISGSLEDGFLALNAFLNLPPEATLEEIVRAVFDYYSIAIEGNAFRAVNNSLFMNIVNALLRLKNLKGISHGNFDMYIRERIKEIPLSERQKRRQVLLRDIEDGFLSAVRIANASRVRTESVGGQKKATLQRSEMRFTDAPLVTLPAAAGEGDVARIVMDILRKKPANVDVVQAELMKMGQTGRAILDAEFDKSTAELENRFSLDILPRLLVEIFGRFGMTEALAQEITAEATVSGVVDARRSEARVDIGKTQRMTSAIYDVINDMPGTGVPMIVNNGPDAMFVVDSLRKIEIERLYVLYDGNNPVGRGWNDAARVVMKYRFGERKSANALVGDMIKGNDGEALMAFLTAELGVEQRGLLSILANFRSEDNPELKKLVCAAAVLINRIFASASPMDQELMKVNPGMLIAKLKEKGIDLLALSARNGVLVMNMETLAQEFSAQKDIATAA
jgi:hypothetical protein